MVYLERIESLSEAENRSISSRLISKSVTLSIIGDKTLFGNDNNK